MSARLILAGLLLSAAACADEPKKQLAPTAPPLSKSVTAAVPAAAQSTVCLRYARDQALAQADIKDHPTSKRALERVQKMDELLKDACQ